MTQRVLVAVSSLLAVALVASLGTVRADKPVKLKSYKGQAGKTFVNEEAVPAHGLHVTLSGKGEVITNDETGYAGPFRDVRDNDSKHLILTNPKEPIPGGGEGQVDLTFRSYQKKLKITGWWWVDEKGKRIGEKRKP